MTPKRYVSTSVEPVNLTLLGKKSCLRCNYVADVITLRSLERGHPGLKVGPNPMTSVPIGDTQKGDP